MNQFENLCESIKFISGYLACLILKAKEIVPYIFSAHIFNIRVHEIAYGFGGPSEKMSIVVNFLLQNTNLVSDRTDEFHEH